MCVRAFVSLCVCVYMHMFLTVSVCSGVCFFLFCGSATLFVCVCAICLVALLFVLKCTSSVLTPCSRVAYFCTAS